MSFNQVLKAMALGAVVAPVMLAQGRGGGGGGAAVVAPRAAPEIYRSMVSGNAGARLGLTTSSSASARDTLGLLVSNIVAGGPAEKAGIAEGSRIVAVNGVDIRIAAADVGDAQLSDLMGRRLTRELAKVTNGTDVELRVVSGGQTRTVKVATVDPSTLASANARTVTRFSPAVGGVYHATSGDGAAVGMALGGTGSKRDTLGVFVMSVDEGGPAEKAGIIEGMRIQAVNGIDLRIPSADAGDQALVGARARRLQREIESLKPGDQVELKVYSAGSMRTLKVTTVKASDLPRRSQFISVGDNMLHIAPMMRDIRMHIDTTLHGNMLRVNGIMDNVRIHLDSTIRLRRDTLRDLRIRVDTTAKVQRIVRGG
jgi:serine protease Do